MITLKTTVRGLRLAATEPDVRYRRHHLVFVHPHVTSYRDAAVVHTPARYSDAGTLLCSAAQRWERCGTYVDPSVAPRSGLGEDRGLYCEVLGERIPASDPEVQALRAELAVLDQEWSTSHAGALAAEDRRTALVSAAHAADDEHGRCFALPAAETECLECGAVYSEPGHVEAGAMSCDRCG